MEIAYFPIQKEILQQIVSEVGISNKRHEQTLKLQLDRKYHKHINLIHYNHLREDRFMLAQKKALQKQHISLQKTKELIQSKQHKAHSNKHHSVIERTKRVESDLSRWQQVVEKNKQTHQKKLKQSLRLIREWNEKLSESESRKSLRLHNVSKTLQERSNLKSSKVVSYRKSLERQRQSQLAQFNKPDSDPFKKLEQSRYHNSITVKKHYRISTQTMHDRGRQNQEDVLEKFLIKAGEKYEKISQARYVKHCLLEKKQTCIQQREENMKKIRQQKLSQIQHELQERNQVLDQKFKSERPKHRQNKSSLPSVSGSRADIVLENGQSAVNNQQPTNKRVSPSERKLEKQETLERCQDWSSPSYDKIIVQKLRNVALLVRKTKQP